MDGNVETQTTETTPAPAPEQATQESPQENQEQPSQPNGKPAGFDPVDFKTATPEEVEARVNRLFGNLKRTEKENKELRHAQDILTERFNELYQNQSQVVSHLQNNDFVNTEATLRQQQRTAWEKGDLDGYHSATEKLIEVKTQKAVANKQPRQQKPNETNQLQPNRAISATDALEMSVASGETSPDEARVLRAYFSERDENGNQKRPWVNGNDVRYSQVSRIGDLVFDPNHPVFGSWNLSQKLAEVDRQMGLRSATQQGSNVLPAGNLTGQRKTSNVKLSPQEETIAVRTKFGGPKAKSDAEHKAAYLQAKIKHGGR